MMVKRVVLASLGLSLILLASTAAAQSLGDVARQQKEKQGKQTKKPTKVYTNENMPARPPGEGPTAATGINSTPPAESAVGPAGATQPPEGEKAPSEDKKKTRDYWQGKFKSARAQLADAEEVQRLAEDELSLLQVQQARELNTSLASELGNKITVKKAELESKRATTSKARKALEDLDKEFKESAAREEWSKT